MASYAVLTHGDRAAGTSTGTYVLPPNVTVYFFTADTLLLNSAGGEIIEDNLLTAHPNELGVRAVAAEVKKGWDTIPNYTATGDAAGVFRYATGVYRVGQDPRPDWSFPSRQEPQGASPRSLEARAAAHLVCTSIGSHVGRLLSISASSAKAAKP